MKKEEKEIKKEKCFQQNKASLADIHELIHVNTNPKKVKIEVYEIKKEENCL